MVRFQWIIYVVFAIICPCSSIIINKQDHDLGDKIIVLDLEHQFVENHEHHQPPNIPRKGYSLVDLT